MPLGPFFFCMFPVRTLFRLAVISLAGVSLLSACTSLPETMPGLDRNVSFSAADFDNSGMFTRHVEASQGRTCEAARRALLSQGYLVDTATSERVTGRKYYQPTNDIHYQVEMRVVCAPESTNDERTAAYASALQDRYVIKKINNSASLGVGAIGSVSLPVSATEDTLVKVGSETVSDPKFYERFFLLFDRYVPLAAPGTRPVLPEPVPEAPALGKGKAAQTTTGSVPAQQPVPTAALPAQHTEATEDRRDTSLPDTAAPEAAAAAMPSAADKPASGAMSESPIDNMIEKLMVE